MTPALCPETSLSLVESTRHPHLRDLLYLSLGQAKAQRRLRHEERVLAKQRVAEWQDIVRLQRETTSSALPFYERLTVVRAV